MVRKPNWNESEFKIVMNSYGLSIEEVVQRLQKCRPEVGRKHGAIEIVIEGIHIFHLGEENHGILSQMMIDILKKKQHPIRCPKCGKKF